MLISELSARSGVPVPTVKFYLRAKLLHAGVATSATRSSYDDTHLRRLRLIKALAEVAGMRLEQVRSVLTAVDDPQTSLHDALGSALSPSEPANAASAAQQQRADELIERWQWEVEPDSYNREGLAVALAALASLDHPLPDDLLDRYAAALHDIADAEIATVPTHSREEAVVHAVIGTLLVEPLIASIRRLAQEEISHRRLSRPVRTGRRSRG